MEALLRYLYRRLRPRVGWTIGLLALGAGGAPGLAAGDAALDLPAGLILWAGLLGAAIGLRLARPMGRPWRAPLLVALVAIGAVLVVAGGAALPPLGLIAGDLMTALGALAARLGLAPVGEPTPPLTGRFLALSLPRLWRALADAPGSGEAGAALIVTTLALVTTWAGAITLGWAAGGLRRSLAWGLPLLGALGLTTILSGGEGGGLVIGVCLLLALGVVIGHTARERGWDAGGYAYPDQLGAGAVGWGAAAAVVAAGVALALPTALPNLAASLPGADAQLPSGIAAIEGHVRRGQPAPAVDSGLSRLPAIALGVSLGHGPPGAVSLRIRVREPLAPGPWPRYWRTRVLNLYTGSAWASNARVGPFSGPADEAPPGAIRQEVEDLRADRAVLVALPEALGVSRPALAERLPDGSLAALAPAPDGPEPARGQPGARYTVVSLPQELSSAGGGQPGAPPSRSDTLGLPGSVPQRVRDLALTVAEGEATPMGQALALEAYLRRLPYTYEVRPLPGGGDAVDQFLFEMRHGYCTYYASAMAVLARSLGIPARVAIGYATGEYDPASGAYTVRERDAHAWPELLIDGRWLPFEPTPVRPQPARSAGGTIPPPATTTGAEPVAAPKPLWQVWAGLVLAGAGIAAGVAGWLLWRHTRVTPLDQAQLRLERLGARAGVPWPVGATVQEYGRLLSARATGPCDALSELVGLIERARYSGRGLSPTEERRLRSAGALVSARLRRRWPQARTR